MYILTYMKHFTCTLEQINSIQITTVRQIWATEYKCIYEGWLSGLMLYGLCFFSSFFFVFVFRCSSAFVYYTEPYGKLKNREGLGMKLALWSSRTRMTMHTEGAC